MTGNLFEECGYDVHCLHDLHIHTAEESPDGIQGTFEVRCPEGCKDFAVRAEVKLTLQGIDVDQVRCPFNGILLSLAPQWAFTFDIARCPPGDYKVRVKHAGTRIELAEPTWEQVLAGLAEEGNG